MNLLLAALVGAVVAMVLFGGLVGFVFLRPHRGMRMAASSRDPGELPKRTPRPPDRGEDQDWTPGEFGRPWEGPLESPFRGAQELHHGPGPEDRMDRLADAYMAGKHARAPAAAGLAGGPDRRMHRGVWELYAAVAAAQ